MESEASAAPEVETTVVVGTRTPNIFGSLNAVLSEMFSQTVGVALEKGIATLPTVGDNKTLLERLQTTYAKMVDLFELYNRRNIFTLDTVNPSSIRDTATQLYLDTPDVKTLLEDSATTNAPSSPLPSNPAEGETEKYTVSSPVQPEELEALQAEILQLQQRKEGLRQTLHRLQTELQQVAVATQLGTKVADTLVDSVRLAPTEVWNCSKALETTITQAEECFLRMAKRKKENQGSQNDIVTVPGKKHRRRRALKDRFPLDRSNTDDDAVDSVLKEL